MAQEGSTFSAADVRVELRRRMNSKKFMSDMDQYLSVGAVYDHMQACEEFAQVFLPHLDG